MVENKRRTVINKYTLGLDSKFGTLNRKAVLVSVKTGEVLATSIYNYPDGVYVFIYCIKN